MYEYYITRRYLSSRKQTGFISFINAIAILGVAIGTTVLIIALAIITGFERELTEKLIGFSAHIQVQGFQNQPLYDYQQNYDRLMEMDEIKTVSPFIQRESLIRSRENVEGILLKGIIPEYDVSFVRQYINVGEFDLVEKEPNRYGIVIGDKLARKLQVDIGDMVTVFALDHVEGMTIGFARAGQFIVTGVYETGMAEYDDIYVFVDLNSAQRMLRLDTAVSGYDILLYDVTKIEKVKDTLFTLLGYPHYPRTMYQMYRHLFTWIELQKKPIPLVLGLIILVAVVNIIGTLLMLVIEKSKHIGVLKTLGSTRKEIGKIFVFNGMVIGLIGVLLGNVLGFTLSFIQYQYKPISIPGEIYYMNFVPIALEPIHYIVVSVIALLMCFISTLIPARLAARLDPIRIIRFA